MQNNENASEAVENNSGDIMIAAVGDVTPV